MLLKILQGAARRLLASSTLPSSRLSAHRSIWNGTTRTRRLVPARLPHPSPSHPSSVRCHAKKKGPSSSKGRRNDDEELARQAMRAMEALGGSSPQVPRRKQGGDARVAVMDVDFLATKARKQPTLAEALDNIEAAVSLPASATARMLYDIGTALNKERVGVQEGRIASAVAKLTDLMLEELKGSSSSSSSSSSAQRVQLLKGGREFNLCAWALSKVQPIRGTDVTQLGLALTEQALHGPVMDGEGWRGWSALLYGLSKAGMSCSDGKVQQLFTLAVTQRLPELLAQGGDCNSQDVSNTLLACVQAGYSQGDLQVLVSALASPAGVRILHADDAKPQAISNVVWALAALKFYDAGLFCVASRASLERYEICNGHDFGNLFYSCAEAQHWDSSMEALAELISKQSAQQWQEWKAQDITNSLYSWAVLTATGAAPASHGFASMAQQLFSQAVRRGALVAEAQHLRQLFMAHQVAVHVGLPGGGMFADHVLLQACAGSYGAQQAGLQKQIRSTASLEVAAALQHAGYDVERAVLVESEFVQLQAQGIAVTVAVVDNYFRVPRSLLRGSTALHSVLASWVCRGSVVISEAEWAGLKGDTQQQKAFVAQLLQQALS